MTRTRPPLPACHFACPVEAAHWERHFERAEQLDAARASGRRWRATTVVLAVILVLVVFL